MLPEVEDLSLLLALILGNLTVVQVLVQKSFKSSFGVGLDISHH